MLAKAAPPLRFPRALVEGVVRRVAQGLEGLRGDTAAGSVVKRGRCFEWRRGKALQWMELVEALGLVRWEWIVAYSRPLSHLIHRRDREERCEVKEIEGEEHRLNRKAAESQI